MRKIIYLVLLLGMHEVTFSQRLPDTMTFDIRELKDLEKAESKMMLFIDSNATLSPEEIPSQHFIPLSSFRRKASIPGRLTSSRFWLSFTLKNSLPEEKRIWFYPGNTVNRLLFYKKEANGSLILLDNNPLTGFVPIRIRSGDSTVYFTELKFFKLKYNKFNTAFVENDYLPKYKVALDSPFYERSNGLKLVSGMLLLMVMFTLVNFIISRKSEFFYNFLYSFFMFFLIFFNAYLNRSSGWFRGFFLSWFDLFLLIAATVAYIQFVIIFLSGTIRHAGLDKFLRFEKWALIILMAFYSYLHFFTSSFNAQEMLENAMKIFMLVAGLVFIIIAFRQKDKLTNYLATGTAVQIFCYIVSLVILISDIGQNYLITSAGFYFALGAIASVVFYLMGLTYKNRADLIEKLRERQEMKMEMEKKEFEKKLDVLHATQNERNRISADMHDDLGAGMTTIRLYSEIALNKPGGENIPEIKKISNSANDLLNKMNAIIWSMSSSNDTFQNMLAYIRSYAIGYCEDNKINCKVILPETVPQVEVSGEIRRNVFLVVKEALHNIVKHSGASQVNLELKFDTENMTFTIHDNGKGIDPEKLNTFGNGLRNMRKRMEDLHIGFNMENNNGTLITLSRKLRRDL